MTEAIQSALDQVRAELATLETWGASEQVRAAERAVDLFERRLNQALLEPLSIDAAAEESGYSEQHLRRLVRDEVIPNAGEFHKPMIRRWNLPKKPGHPSGDVGRPDGSIGSKEQVARQVAESLKGGSDG